MESPYFPKRAVVTNGMPYGNKDLHLGHVGGGFIHSDIYARFLRDRIGAENVIYVSGADCYGSGTEVKYQEALNNGFVGSIRDFNAEKHKRQKEELDAYGISLDIYAASALPPAVDNHHKLSAELFESWYENGYLRQEEVEQFYDDEKQIILNGRQVEGKCPFLGCKAETAYADECALGHQYSPRELINPKSVLSGKTPTLRPVKNWYFDLERFGEELKKRQEKLREEKISRRFLLSNIDDFLKDPSILIHNLTDFDNLRQACEKMPAHEAEVSEKKKSAVLTFKVLKDREKACEILREHSIRFRTDTTLVPFRLTGDIKWGIPVPEKDGVKDQTMWVWPESLWAPISFVMTVLELNNQPVSDWIKWWFDSDARVYQFIGEDNIYFYSVAGMGLFMAMNEIAKRDVQDNLPVVIPNRHVFYGGSKASTSGAIKPPGAKELLDYYTVEQLRMHFAHMALYSNSISFAPKAILGGEGFDPTLAEGNLLTNIYNRLVRSCFYTVQKHFDSKLPEAKISEEVRQAADTMINDYEWAMYRFEFAKVIDKLDVYLRNANKAWSAQIKDETKLAQTLVDAFHVVRVAAALLHPFVPEGTERVREYLGVDERIWDWSCFKEPLEYNLKQLEPKVDFFHKHPSQIPGA